MTDVTTIRRSFWAERRVFGQAWYKNRVPLWVERYLIPICAAIVFGIVILNPLKFDWQQRAALLVAVSAFAYFLAHTVHKSKSSSNQATLTDPRISGLEQEIGNLRSQQQKLLDQQSRLDAEKNRRREVQDKIAEFMTAGNSLRTDWAAKVGSPESVQQGCANSVKQWNAEVESYLKAIPRGNFYLAKFKNRTPSSAVYPLGLQMNLAGWWNLLDSDLYRLDEFVKDADLGKP